MSPSPQSEALKSNPLIGVTPRQLDLLRKNLHRLSPSEKEETLKLLDELEKRKRIEAAQSSLLDFILLMEPTYKIGKHHRKLAELLEAVANGEKDRIIVNIAPRFGKSHLVSYYYPAWFLGRNPSLKVMMASHTQDLAVDFGRKVRNLIDSAEYKSVFPDVSLSADSKSAGRWHTNHGGEYFAIGVGGALAGRGADLLLVDDPHSEQDVLAGNTEVFERAYQWFTTGARTRLMPGGRIAIVQCMVGDTRVLMHDGSYKFLREVRPGDCVASYDEGRLVGARVLNWASNGFDRVFTVKTTSGTTVRANERHPFLVRTASGEFRWVRLRSLKPGMTVVKLDPASGKGRPAPTTVARPRYTPEVSVLPLDTPRTSRQPLPSRITSDFTVDPIVEVSPAGMEEVFDVQIEGTENFIADGLVSHNTRWATNDLTGRLLKAQAMNEDADQYEPVEFPAILETRHGPKSLWPEQWPLPSLLRTKASMPPFQWSAQYQQDPTSEEGAIVKREWWKRWMQERPPKCSYIIQSWDTAFETTTRADYSACTTWGVWYSEDDKDRIELGKKPLGANIMLLNAFKERLEFPDLKRKALEQYQRYEPDTCIIEKKASGGPLIYELRSIGVPVSEYTPGKGQDKVARLNSVADLFSSGIVWVPDGPRWAEEVIDEVASFPVGSHDDLVDATTLALMRFRQGGFLRLASDEPFDNEWARSRKSYAYY